jgi:hypothetical protein
MLRKNFRLTGILALHQISLFDSFVHYALKYKHG